MNKGKIITISEDEIIQKVSEDFGIPEKKIKNIPHNELENIEFALIDFLENSVAKVPDEDSMLKSSPTQEKREKLLTFEDKSSEDEFFGLMDQSLECIGNVTINVKKTFWILLGLILDILLTKGATTVIFSALGLIGQCIGKLNKENGEICIYKAIAEDKKGRNATHIYNSLAKRISWTAKSGDFSPHFMCSSEDLNCRHRTESGCCSISLEDIQNNLNRMEKIGAIVYNTIDKKWRIAF